MNHYTADTFTSSRSIGYLMKLAHGLMHDRVSEAFAMHDLSFVQWIALRRVAEGHARTASELCRAMCHDTGALTRLIDQLESRGYLARERSREDRRVVELAVLPAGHRKLEELTPVVVACLNASLADFSKTEFDELARLLGKLIASLQAPRTSGVAA